MKPKKSTIKKMIAHLQEIKVKAAQLEKQHSYDLSLVHPKYKESALNLLHYLALRHSDLNDLQDRLAELGLSRLAKAESHVMASIDAVMNTLQSLIREKKGVSRSVILSMREGRGRIKTHTDALLGKKLKGSTVRIMVTMPGEAATDKKIVKDVLKSGMNSARINCAHDDTGTWKKIIEKIHRARKKTGRNCRICMDLGGPKLRTGAMVEGPKVIHVQPQRDLLGKVTSPAELILTSKKPPFPESPYPFLPVSTEWLKRLRKKDQIVFNDARNKQCKLLIKNRSPLGVHTECFDSAYIVSGRQVRIQRDSKDLKAATTIGDMPPREERIVLNVGDTLLLHKDPRPGEPAVYDKEGNLVRPAHISCTMPEIFQDVRVGEPIIFDDGKIEGQIKHIHTDQLEIKIVYAKEGGAKLAGDKGINLPESNLRLHGLTNKDREDLVFIAAHAETVNLSFVNSPADVSDLIRALSDLDGRGLGIIIKIETKSGYENLPAILLTAMRHYPAGVMLARGDLAIESGWVNLAQIQEEIMWLCEAAHLPVIWATQVLETLAKKGRPSRAEITDAAMAQRAECVMLNKGPFIVETIQLLDRIMKSMQNYQRKKSPKLPAMTVDDFLNIQTDL